MGTIACVDAVPADAVVPTRCTLQLTQHTSTGVPDATFGRVHAHALLRAEDTLVEIDRIAPLERNILRAALLELRDPELVQGERPIPPEAAIDEAVETAKTYCGVDAPGFVNGILAAALREVRENPGAR